MRLYPHGYKVIMIPVLGTEVFESWLKRLKDPRGKARIIHRIRALERGHFGDSRSVGPGVVELRIHVGPGYRVYLKRERETICTLLCGGDKSTQQKDILRAIELAKLLEPY